MRSEKILISKHVFIGSRILSPSGTTEWVVLYSCWWMHQSIINGNTQIVNHLGIFDFWPVVRHALRTTPHGEKPLSVEEYERETGKVAKDRKIELLKGLRSWYQCLDSRRLKQHSVTRSALDSRVSISFLVNIYIYVVNIWILWVEIKS